MLKYALLAIGAALVLGLVFILLPIHGGPRPEPRILASGDPPASTSFTIRDAAPPVPAEAAPPAPAPDLDAVMQRLRNGGPAGSPTADATTPPMALPPVTVPTPPSLATPPAVPAVPDAPDATEATAPPRLTTATAQGTRWRMARTPTGYTVSIDLGGGRIADVHVLPAFGNLDPAAINVRVDYLRATILQSFPPQSGSFNFNRDGSVSLQR